MTAYVVLLRGVNVGGKNKIAMADLKKCLEKMGFSSVSTYIASGNVILASSLSPDEIKDQIEKALIKNFKFDSKLIKVLVLNKAQLKSIVANRPKGFGDQPGKYHSDVIFLMNKDAGQAFKVFDPRPEVDTIWQGKQVIYSQRLSAQSTKSRLNKVMSSPFYKSMTIRTWNTAVKLLDILESVRTPG